MAHERTDSYLRDAITIFRYYKSLGENAIAQCPDQGLVTQIDPESNSIGIIVKHLAGNMRSRWTEFLTSDGEKPNRNRDAEFEDPPKNRTEILDLWDGGWKCVFTTLEALSDADLTKTVTVRGEEHSVMQAIHRQIAHYSGHVGQIIFLAKHFAGSNWKSLTIPKSKSKEFSNDVASDKKSQR
jgi:Protein of unknown function (DUF1572)